MIRVARMTIHEFRGIRDLTIDFKGQNFAICGPNGTGKSGVVDALEFALTGNISRLSGRGTREVSIKDHAPHVDSRNNPERAKVSLTAFIPNLNKEVTIERTVRQPQSPNISDKTPEVLAILKEVSDHPEFVLSRRELIDYVLSTPGDRAKEVQALLRLDAIESQRALFLKISNATNKEVAPLTREKATSRDNFLRALNIAQFHREKVLEAINQRRNTLGLEPLKEFVATTSFKDGLAAKAAGQASAIPKVQAMADIARLKEISQQLEGSEFREQRTTVTEQLVTLNADPHLAASAKREHLLKSAIDLIEWGCPVCDTPWDPQALREHIEGKLKYFDELSKSRQKLEQALSPLIEIVRSWEELLDTLGRYGTQLKPAIDTTKIKLLSGLLAQRIQKLRTFIPIPETINALNDLTSVPDGIKDVLEKIEAGVAAIPEPTQQDAARDFLTVGQERLEAYQGVSQRLKKAEEQGQLAKAVYEAYTKVSTGELEGIYQSVATEFAEFYSFINSDDEKNFTAKLIPSMGKLGFDVDFYGRGHFPPGAYHSEGHQDGMGLCLYLALMKRLLNDKFSFAVLDDVLMSVDTGHRREVCKLLQDKFPNTQFILTTHDSIWLRHMKTVGLIGDHSQLHFRSWDVDHGPNEWDGKNVWQEIAEALTKNDVRTAAGQLRRYLEYFSTEVCHALRAKVPFRGDARYQLGELLPAATSQFKKYLKEGKAAAQSWGKAEDVTAIDRREKEFSAAVASSKLEEWQVNAAIHYNEWDNLTSADFAPVAEAFRKITDLMGCATERCGIFYLSSPTPPYDALRCKCGATNINLIKKPTV